MSMLLSLHSDGSFVLNETLHGERLFERVKSELAMGRMLIISTHSPKEEELREIISVCSLLMPTDPTPEQKLGLSRPNKKNK
jgi:hypothetical protein